MSKTLEKSTVWRFPQRGKWSSHKGDYRGNWAPQVPRNLILRYSQEKDVVLDCFTGSGTTQIECKLLNRSSIGIDTNQKAVEICSNRMNISSEYDNEHRIILGDARDLSFLTDESIDLICTHPPYANAISYSNAIENDLSQYDHVDFLRQFKIVTKELHRVLKKRKFCCIMMGDLRKSGNVIPLGFMIMQTCIESGLKLKEIIIKEQFNTTESTYWEKISIQRNFLLLAHEYIFVFYK